MLIYNPMEKNAAIMQALEPARKHQQEQLVHKLPTRARFKLQFIYKNGTYSTPYHSFDRYGERIDERLGLVKLIHLVRKKKGEYVVATIFANYEPEPYVRINGVFAQHYNVIVYKHVNGGQEQYSGRLKFEEGRLIL